MTALPPELFETPLPGLARALTRAEGNAIGNYLNLLTKWQKTQRLVGSTAVNWMIDNLVLDSLAFLAALPPDTVRVADVGSGAGIPGIPIAIVRPNLSVTLIESRRRRTSFLSTAVRELGLSNTEVVEGRVEDLGVSLRERFDVIMMRCAGAPEELLLPVQTLARSGGVVVMAGGQQSNAPRGAETLTIQTLDGRRRLLYRVHKP